MDRLLEIKDYLSEGLNIAGIKKRIAEKEAKRQAAKGCQREGSSKGSSPRHSPAKSLSYDLIAIWSVTLIILFA